MKENRYKIIGGEDTKKEIREELGRISLFYIDGKYIMPEAKTVAWLIEYEGGTILIVKTDREKVEDSLAGLINKFGGGKQNGI